MSYRLSGVLQLCKLFWKSVWNQMAEMFYKCFKLFVIVSNFVLDDIPQISLSIKN